MSLNNTTETNLRSKKSSKAQLFANFKAKIASLEKMELKKDAFFDKYGTKLTTQKKNGCMAYPKFNGKRKLIVFDFSPFFMNKIYDG